MSSASATESDGPRGTREEGDEAESSAEPVTKEDAERARGEEAQKDDDDDAADAPPLPAEPVPPLPSEAAPDDGWDPVWDDTAQAYYFYNRFTQATQWENPRVPDATHAPGLANHERIAEPPAPGTEAAAPAIVPPPQRPYGGYDPAIHGDYDPTASYAQDPAGGVDSDTAAAAGMDPTAAYDAVGGFNRWTGRWQNEGITPENHNDENKSKRQMNAFFDVDAAAKQP